MADRHLLRWSAAAAAALLLPLPWCAWKAYQAGGDLLEVRAAAARTESELRAGDTDGALGTLRELRLHAAEAAETTGGLTWNGMAKLPLAGPAAETVQVLAEAAATLSEAALPVLEHAGPLLRPGAPLLDRSQALPALAASAEPLERADQRLSELRTKVDALPEKTGLADLDAAKELVAGYIDKVHEAVGRAATAARLLPSMLGATAPRHYFLAFQTNAEARGTGGLVGAFAVLTADRGRIRFRTLDSNLGIRYTPTPVIDLGPEYTHLYGSNKARALSVSNLSPHFPNAARIWTSFWRHQTGRSLDGAIAIDPTGLAHILKAVGPLAVTLDNGAAMQLTKDNVVDFIERDEYVTHPDPMVRKRFVLDVARAVAERLTTIRPTGDLLEALSTIAAERRLQLWSRHQDEQRILATTPFGGTLSGAEGPYAGLVINNAAGNKLDYYLERSLTYQVGECREYRRESTVQAELTNQAPLGLPKYVSSREDDTDGPRPEASNKLWVSLFMPLGARLRGAEADGRPLTIQGGMENGHPVHYAMLEMPRGVPRTLRWRFDEPVSSNPPQVPVQPLTRPQRTSVTVPPCALEAAPVGASTALGWPAAAVLFGAGLLMPTGLGLWLTRRRSHRNVNQL